MARKKFVAGNWKMYTTLAGARELAAGVANRLGGEDMVTVAVCPPFPWLIAVAEAIRGSPVALGAQDVHFAQEGAYTGEVSPAMLVEAGCQYTIVGHSERRYGFAEPDRAINRKVKLAIASGLSVIFCVGETLADREANETVSVLEFQLAAGLAGLSADLVPKLVIAYEPVWAIGTGQNATPQQAQDAHAFIRRKFAAQFGDELARTLIIQYGGSVKPDNAAQIMAQPDVDGALVGGASLKIDSFVAIIRSAIVQ